MIALLVFILTMIISYAVNSILIGIALAFVHSKKRFKLRPFSTGIILFFIFMLLDVFEYPAILMLKATLIIHNDSFANLIGRTDVDLGELMAPNFENAIIWAVQVAVAIYIARSFEVKQETS